LKFWVRVVSGELSITRVFCGPPPFALVLPELDELVAEEQAAMPATRKPAAAMAANRFPLNGLAVNIDYPPG
jgi:hypothetical protein